MWLLWIRADCEEMEYLFHTLEEMKSYLLTASTLTDRYKLRYVSIYEKPTQPTREVTEEEEREGLEKFPIPLSRSKDI